MTEPATPFRPPPGPDDFPARGRNSLASIGQRGLARALDTLLEGLPVLVATVPFLAVEDGEVDLSGVPLWVGLLGVVVAVAYETVAIRLWGQTLGKWLLGVKVARFADGARPTTAQAAQRIVLPQAVGAIPVGFAGALMIFVYLTAALDPLRRGVHDKYAGTIVIRTR